jgi:hypothetical protein
LDIGKKLQKSLEIGKNGLDLGLLKHQFGNPYPVRLGILPPGETAAVPLVPTKEFSLQGAHRCHVISNLTKCLTDFKPFGFLVHRR